MQPCIAKYYQLQVLYTLLLLLIARTKFSEFSDDRHFH